MYILNKIFTDLEAAHVKAGIEKPFLIRQIQRTAKFRIKMLRQLSILNIWVNALGDPAYEVGVDPIERQMIYNLLNENG